jgi:23S rRNA (uracil1939-C5)-methyltransferase
MKQEEILIDQFSKKGNGVGTFTRSDGKDCVTEVPFTMPGDKIVATPFKKKGGVYLSRLENILEPAKERVSPPRCVHFSVCGGCRWQHLTYEKQLQEKEASIRDAFAALLPGGIHVRPIIASEPWAYRNKMEFSFSSDAAKNKYLGLIIDSSRGKVLNLTECHLVNSWFLEALKATRSWWQESELEAYHMHHNTGSLRTLILREGITTGDRLAMLTVSGNPEFALNKKQLESFVKAIRESVEPQAPAHLSIFLRIQQIAKGQETNFYEMQLDGPDHIRETLNIQPNASKEPVTLNFEVSPSAFFQPNTRQAEKLYSIALQLAEIPKNGIVYDLYCGTGTLGICAAKSAKQVIGIELSPESSLDARTNLSLNGLDNISIKTGSVDEVLKEMQKEKFPSPDLVVIDPPRAGLDTKALQQLIQLNSPKILYISCNPATQAKNVAELIKQGYEITAIQPVDQFPQTVHIENIVVLSKI